MYTVDENEKAALEGAWHLEGVVCKMPTVSSTATYRLYNPTSGLRLYTADNAEIAKLTGEGWTKEGVAFYATWANSELTYTGQKTAANTTVTTNATASNVINAPGAWCNGLKKSVWYDAGDTFFYIVDDHENDVEVLNIPEAQSYHTFVLPQRYPGMSVLTYGDYGDGFHVAVVSAQNAAVWGIDQSKDQPWLKNSKRGLTGVAEDTATFAPIGADSPWGEFYVLHGTGLGAYYYAIESNPGDNPYYDMRQYAAHYAMSYDLEKSCGGWKNMIATFGNNMNSGSDLVGTWNGLTIRRVYWNM